MNSSLLIHNFAIRSSLVQRSRYNLPFDKGIQPVSKWSLVIESSFQIVFLESEITSSTGSSLLWRYFLLFKLFPWQFKLCNNFFGNSTIPPASVILHHMDFIPKQLLRYYFHWYYFKPTHFMQNSYYGLWYLSLYWRTLYYLTPLSCERHIHILLAFLISIPIYFRFWFHNCITQREFITNVPGYLIQLNTW